VRRRSRLIALLFVATLGVSAAGAQGDDVRAALERGDATAQATLGAIYLRGQGVPVDYAAAARLFRGAAEEGHAAAQNALGLLYAGGLGVAQDYAQAVSWYRRAAEQGAPEHQFDLAVMYDNGLGVERNPALAAEWYGKAAAQGFAEAEASLGFLYQQGAGVPQDLAKAFALYGRAARKGNARAQNNLGLMYTRGEGVAQNYPLAVDWYRKAANQGFAKAITNLGVMYENGFGVAQDEAEARRLYRLGGRQDADATDAVLDQVGFFADPRLARPPDAAARDSVKAAGRARRTGRAVSFGLAAQRRADGRARPAGGGAALCGSGGKRPHRRHGQSRRALSERLGRAAGLHAGLHVDQSGCERAWRGRKAARRAGETDDRRADQRGAGAEPAAE
jgi:TPR repeat protein